MNIIIINITKNWVYRLYEEYIISIKNFLIEKYENINIKIHFFDESSFHLNNFENINFNDIDKIFYTGDLEILKMILHIINYDYSKLYFINVEQMSKPSYYKMIRHVDTNINIIDYSEENIPFFENIYKNVYLFPPYFIENKTAVKNIDVISISNNCYRNNILNKIILNKNSTIFLIDNCYGETRNKYFSESKIYVNIHCSAEHQTMELIRLINLIMNKVIIISEKSIYNNLLFIDKYILICKDMNNLNNCLNDLIDNRLYGNFDPNEYYEYIKKNVDKIFN